MKVNAGAPPPGRPCDSILTRQEVEIVLNAASKLIFEKGAAGINIGNIAVEAGIPTIMLRQIFPDMTSITRALGERFHRVSCACVSDCFSSLDRSPNLAYGLIRMTEAYFDMFRGMPEAGVVFDAVRADPNLRVLEESERDSHAEIIQDAILSCAPQIDDGEAMQFGRLFADLIGSASRSAALLEPQEGREMIDCFIRTILTPAIDRVLSPSC